MVVLGIETSCDETSVCLLKDGKILFLKTFSQIALHKSYGGVVPEIAARSHLEVICPLVTGAFEEAGLGVNIVDVIAVTNRPGLIGGLLVGVNFAKGMAVALGKPIVFVNHLEGHIFTCGLTDNIWEDFYCVLVSGGHTQTIEVADFQNYKVVGRTIDDSLGEAFDKLAKSLGFGYPGGAIVEKTALTGNADAIKFKIPMKGYNDFDFSFSGLKTHFLGVVARGEHSVPDICASFQKIICDILLDRVVNMIEASDTRYKRLVLCGGVSANNYIYGRFCAELGKRGIQVIKAPLELCTDNAAMIANIGAKYASLGLFSGLQENPASTR